MIVAKAHNNVSAVSHRAWILPAFGWQTCIPLTELVCADMAPEAGSPSKWKVWSSASHSSHPSGKRGLEALEWDEMGAIKAGKSNCGGRRGGSYSLWSRGRGIQKSLPFSQFYQLRKTWREGQWVSLLASAVRSGFIQVIMRKESCRAMETGTKWTPPRFSPTTIWGRRVDTGERRSWPLRLTQAARAWPLPLTSRLSPVYHFLSPYP